MLNENSYLSKIGVDKQLLNLNEGEELNLKHPYLDKLPNLPRKVGDKFPAIVHELVSFKGKIIDKGWKVQWFEDENDAKVANERSSREAESFYITKKYFQNIETKEGGDILEIKTPDINLKATKEEIMDLGGISNYEFVYQALSHEYQDVSDFQSEVLGRSGSFKSVFNDYLVKDGKLLISTKLPLGELYKEKHYYNIALKNGAVKSELDEKIINSFNSKIKKLQTEIREQLEQLEVYSSEIDNYLPLFSGSHIEIGDALRQCKELVKNDKSVNSIEEYWELDIPFEYIIQQLNNELKKWNAFWKGSFGIIKEKVDNKEIIINYGGAFRQMGRTGCEDFWVVSSNGDIRPATTVKYRKDYLQEGEKNWDVVLPDELAIYWCKENTGANHVFEIDKLPDKLSEKQINTLKHIQNEIETEWRGLLSMSGKESPSVGNGWLDLVEEENDKGSQSILNDHLQALKDKFNNK